MAGPESSIVQLNVTDNSRESLTEELGPLDSFEDAQHWLQQTGHALLAGRVTNEEAHILLHIVQEHADLSLRQKKAETLEQYSDKMDDTPDWKQ